MAVEEVVIDLKKETVAEKLKEYWVLMGGGLQAAFE